jgi:hypothetical protein
MGQINSRPDTSASLKASTSGCPVPHDSITVANAPVSSSQTAAQCPIDHNPQTVAKCPVDHKSPPNPAKCPIDHENINPLNQMPTLTQKPAQNQTIELPTDRTESSIPRDGQAKWEYPSPQQFYNALVRKGWETPEKHVETMVEIHNFLNEEAWGEVLKWEKRHNRSVSYPWRFCMSLTRGFPATMIYNSPALWVVQVSCHQKHGFGCLQVGCFPLVLGTCFFILLCGHFA